MSDRTDHRAFIVKMRADAEMSRRIRERIADAVERDQLEKHAQFMDCAAALLECHDDTGISLDDWRGPRELVVTALRMVGGVLTENHV